MRVQTQAAQRRELLTHIVIAGGVAATVGAVGFVAGDSTATNRISDAAGQERVERPWLGLKSVVAAKAIDPTGSVAKATAAARAAAAKKETAKA